MAKITSKDDKILVKLVRARTRNKAPETEQVNVMSSGRVLWRFKGKSKSGKPILTPWTNKKTISTDDASVKKELRSWHGKGFYKA